MIQDDFSLGLGKWTQQVGTWTIDANEQLVVPYDGTLGGRKLIVYSDEQTSGPDQYAKVTIPIFSSSDNWVGLGFRYTDNASSFYDINIDIGANTGIDRVVGQTWQETYLYSTAITWSNGDTIGASVEGVGPATTFKIWKNPVGNTPAEWGTPGITFVKTTGGEVNAGNYLNLGYWGRGADATYDDFFAADIPVYDLTNIHEGNIVNICADDRIINIESDDRDIAIPADDRIINVR